MELWDYKNLRDLRNEIRKGNVESNPKFNLMGRDGRSFTLSLGEVMGMFHEYDLSKIDTSVVTSEELMAIPEDYFRSTMSEYHTMTDSELDQMYADFLTAPRQFLRNRSRPEVVLKIIERALWQRD